MNDPRKAGASLPGIGIIGGGLMGREAAIAIARWPALLETGLPRPRLVAVADVNPAVLDWYEAPHKFIDYQQLVALDEVDVVYVAVPHHLHEKIYCDVLDAGKDLFAEKPFGIDAVACRRILKKVKETGRFVRCSSEFPFYPVVQQAYDYLLATNIGIPIEGRCAFLHSSDLDPAKPINWKRQVATCGEVGVMGDLGLHVCHLPFRLGFKSRTVFAKLQKIYYERPDGHGGIAACDTWDNATIHSEIEWKDSVFPFAFEMKRIAPGEMNTWEFELIGTEGGVRVSTKHPKTLSIFGGSRPYQGWTQIDVGSQSVIKTITGPIFETGFSDAILQMWGAYIAERAGTLGGRFGCASPEEALRSHRLFHAALDQAALRALRMRPVPKDDGGAGA